KQCSTYSTLRDSACFFISGILLAAIGRYSRFLILFNIEMIINDIKFIFLMTMGCPLCGSMMFWLNGSISHDPPVKQYECRNCNIRVTKQPDGSYEIIQLKDH